VTDDIAVGKFLEALHQTGGFSELLPMVAGVSAEELFEAADRAEACGYIVGSSQRNAANRLSSIINMTLTARGTTYLERYRAIVSHAGGGPATALDVHSSVESRVLRRTQFMRALYDKSGASESRFVDGPLLGDDFSWPREETDDVMRYWEGEGLIRYIADEGLIAITHQGIVEIEQAMTKPAVATTHFAPNTVIIYGDVNGSQIQAGSTHSSQSQTVEASSGMEDAVLLEFLRAMRAALAAAPLGGIDHDEAEEMIALVEVELARAEPNNRLVKTVTSALRELSLGMAASGGWAAVVALAHQLPH
jgi:hypothetical protein